MFNPRPWLDEGDRLLATARINRSLFRRRRNRFPTNRDRTSTRHLDKAKLWNEVEGTARASWLLLGYAVEMYLKSGLAKAYAGCSESMFERDLKSRFRHNLPQIAQEIGFHANPEQQRLLSELRETLLAGRYPLHASDGEEYMTSVNARTSNEWNEKIFRALIDLATRIRAHVARIDFDSNAPAFKRSVLVDADGYVAFRSGGHLPTRITYCLSSEQKSRGQTKAQDVISLLTEGNALRFITSNWNSAEVYEDGENSKGEPITIRRL